MKRMMLCALIGATGVALIACKAPFNDIPDFIQGDIQQTSYDGITDDLLTAGLGASGLGSTPAPTFADPLDPTTAELRRLAIYNNYRALVDTSAGGGYGSFTIRQGDGPVITEHSRSLLDYTTALAVYQGCANQALAIRDVAPLNAAFNLLAIGENICNSLANKALVTGATLDDRATDALRILNEEFGVQPEQNLLAPVHFGLAVAQSISMTYANAYGRAGVENRVCDLSLAATDTAGAVTQLAPADEAVLFSVSNGIPPTGGVKIVFDSAEGQPTNLAASASPSSSQLDYGLDALLCLRSLAQGSDAVTGAGLEGPKAELASAIAGGIADVRATGDLQGKPAVFVTGRADAILPINHTSRPYFGLNQRVEGKKSNLRYYEILNAHHLDVLNGFPGIADRYVPLHHYYFQALDLVWEHLTEKQPLPPSQVVRTVPRGAITNPLTDANLPAIKLSPDQGDRIVFAKNQLRIPE